MTSKRAAFLDRDGVLNRTFFREGATRPPRNLDELEVLPGVGEATIRLKAAGFLRIVVTNQPDVARGTVTRNSVEAINDRMCSELALTDVLVCWHDRNDGCACRKPKPGMLREAAKLWNIDVADSVMIGDRWSDIHAGQAAGCRTVLVETPHSGRERCVPDHCVASLLEAVDWVLANMDERGAK